MIDRLRETLRPEDLVLLAWSAVGWPIAVAIFGGMEAGSLFDAGHPLRGLFWIVAVACALIVLGTRNREDPDRLDEDPLAARLGMFGPLVGGMGLVASGGLAGLGLEPDPGFGLVFVTSLVLIVAAGMSRVPALPRDARRALVTPFVIAAAGIFGGTMASIGLGPTLLQDAFGGAGSLTPNAGEIVAAIALSAGLFVLFSAPFYAMLVFAPRRLAEPEGSPFTWLVRYMVFVAGSLLGVGWLAAAGG